MQHLSQTSYKYFIHIIHFKVLCYCVNFFRKAKISVLICFFVSIGLFAKADGFPESYTDTIGPLKILNAYFNKNTGVENINVTFDFYIDSVLFYNPFTTSEKSLLLYVKALHKLNEEDFQFIIDSILDLDSVPLSFIYAVDYCLDIQMDNNVSTIPCLKNDFTEYSYYPTSGLYNHIWCSALPHPYPPELHELDSILEIQIINDTLKFAMPCDEVRVTSKFGWRNQRMHHGIDLGLNYGLPVYATFDGVIRFAKLYSGYGRLVIIRHYNGLETYYAHLSRLNVKPGQQVKAGDIIGKAGNTGNSRGTHLHFEIRYKGLSINPAHIISFEDNILINEKIILKKVKQHFYIFNQNAIAYTVKSGDYLNKIAVEYGTTVAKICEHNNISRNSTLKVGQLLMINL